VDLAGWRADTEQLLSSCLLKNMPELRLDNDNAAKAVGWLRPQDVSRLLFCGNHHLRLFVILALSTGARPVEILDMIWDHVDLVRQRVHIPRSRCRDGRDVFLNRRAMAALARVEDRNGPVIRRLDGTPYRRKPGQNGGAQVKAAFAGACHRAGIECTPITLRHTWAVWFYAFHRNTDKLIAAGGWQDRRMISRYVAVGGHELDAVVATLRSPRWVDMIPAGR
jgi:integrase